MKIHHYLIATALTISSLMAAWESIGPYGGPLRPLACAPSDYNTMYTATFSGGYPSVIYRTNDAGASWNEAGTISDYYYIFSLAVDPANADIVYGGSSGRFYTSTDAGMTWSWIPLSDGDIYALAINALQPGTIFAVGQTYGGEYYSIAFFKSTDSGVNWDTLVLDTLMGYATCLVLDPIDSMTLYVGGMSYDTLPIPRVYKSIDGGQSFTNISKGIPSSSCWVSALAVHPSNTDYLYAGTYIGIYRSTDGGMTWSEVAPYWNTVTLATTPAEPNVAYAGADTAVYKSTDAGASWFATSLDFLGQYFYGLMAHPTQPMTVYATNNAGCIATTDGGTTWFESNYGINMSPIATFSLAPSALTTMYVELSNIGVYKTTDGGTTWTSLPKFLICGTICSFAVHNNDPSTVLALEGVG